MVCVLEIVHALQYNRHAIQLDPLFYDGCVSADHNPDSHMDKAAIICHVLSREIQEALVC